MSDMRVDIQWTPRRRPLLAVAAAARGDVADALVTRLLELDDEALGRLRGVAADNLVLLLGARDDLPWVDGVTYFGRAEGAPDLLVPTTLAPTVPESLLARAVAHARIPAPVAVLVDKKTLVSFAEARPLAKAYLRAWRDGTEAPA